MNIEKDLLKLQRIMDKCRTAGQNLTPQNKEVLVSRVWELHGSHDDLQFVVNNTINVVARRLRIEQAYSIPQ